MTDLSFIEQYVGKSLIIPKNKTKIEVIRKLTHLYLNDKFITQIGFIGVCENLQVLYLHNNEITKINDNLAPLRTLKHLYLQKNKIRKIEGLQTLTQLRKLYIGSNEISVIEGLDRLQNLEELHVEKQRLTKGECLCFDPRTMFNLSNTLQVLNISHNNLTLLNSLEALKCLKYLNASYNQLSNIEEVVKVVHNLFHLQEVNFIGNPIAKQYRYKDNIIANTFRLITLDNKNINETTRNFIKRFEYQKSQHRFNSAYRIATPKNLPGEVPPTHQKAIKQSISKTMSTTVLTTSLNDKIDEDVKYLPWKALKPAVSDSGKVCPPLFTKIQQQKRPGVGAGIPEKRVTFNIFPDMPQYDE